MASGIFVISPGISLVLCFREQFDARMYQRRGRSRLAPGSARCQGNMWYPDRRIVGLGVFFSLPEVIMIEKCDFRHEGQGDL